MCVAILAEVALDHSEEALQRAEAVDDCGRFITATDHAVGALGVAAGSAVFCPLGGLKQFLVTLRVAFLKQIARLLPAKDAVGGHAPRNALITAIAHEELKEQGRHIELPGWLAVR